MVTKYEIAKAFLECQQKCDEFYESLPQSLRDAFVENPLNLAHEELQHLLLSELLTLEQLDDLYYFAYESNPRVEWEGKEFYTLESYWQYCDSKTTLNFVGSKL